MQSTIRFVQYVSHLNPKNEFFFQRPKRVKDVSDDVWYDNMVVGQRTLGEKMKKLSTDAELSYIYTNHSTRATSRFLTSVDMKRDISWQSRTTKAKTASEVMRLEQV